MEKRLSKQEKKDFFMTLKECKEHANRKNKISPLVIEMEKLVNLNEYPSDNLFENLAIEIFNSTETTDPKYETEKYTLGYISHQLLTIWAQDYTKLSDASSLVSFIDYDIFHADDPDRAYQDTTKAKLRYLNNHCFEH